MKVDWTNAEHIDGPGLVAWMEREEIIPRRGVDAVVGENVGRRIRAWRKGGRASIWLADVILTRRGRHIREIPPHLFLIEPIVLVRQVVEQGRPISAAARAGGFSVALANYWRRRVEKQLAESSGLVSTVPDGAGYAGAHS